MKTREQGFTLIELLITVTIFGIIGAIGVNVIGLGFSTYTSSDQRLGESLDRQLVVVGFEKDVAGASTVNTVGGACVTGSIVAHFSATDVTNVIDVYYSVPSAFVAPGTLTRTKCINGAISSSSNVVTRLSAVPSMACITSCATSLTTVTLTIPEAGGTFAVQGRRRL